MFSKLLALAQASEGEVKAFPLPRSGACVDQQELKAWVAAMSARCTSTVFEAVKCMQKQRNVDAVNLAVFAPASGRAFGDVVY